MSGPALSFFFAARLFEEPLKHGAEAPCGIESANELQGLQVWAGNAARAMQERYAGHRTGIVTTFKFGGSLNFAAAGRIPERGYQGETGA